MAKTLTAANVETQEAAAGRRRTRISRTLLLITKNILFWGSIALSCYGLYRLAIYLIG